MGHRPFVLMTIALLALAPALAGRAGSAGGGSGDGSGPRTVYAGEPASPAAAGRVARMLALMDPAIILDTAPVHLDELVDQERFHLLGVDGSSLSACEGGDVSAEQYRSDLDTLYSEYMATNDTRLLIERIDAERACLTEVVPPADLARIHFLAGVIAADIAEDRERALHAFRNTKAMDKSAQWDPNFAPGGQLLFADALLEVIEAERASIRVLGGEGEGVWVGGMGM